MLALVLLAGACERWVLLESSPRYGYAGDVLANLTMGLSAEKYGLLNIYSISQQQNTEVKYRAFEQDQVVERTWKTHIPPSYPPASVSMFMLQAKLFKWLDPTLTGNTPTARLVMTFPAFAGDLLLAVSVFLVGTTFLSRKWACFAASTCWLFPPLAMVTAMWGQIDSMPLGLSVLAMYFMLRSRWALAGVALGVAALLKPQAILMGPVVLFAAMVCRKSDAEKLLPAAAMRLCKLAIAALATVLVVASPWMIHSGLAWVDRSYLSNFRIYEYTTLKAFNLWYLDALGLDAHATIRALDPSQAILGLSKDRWGQLLLLLSLAAAAAVCWKKYRSSPALAVTIFSMLWLWSAFMLPTRAHERYIAYCLPAAIIAACGLRRLWPAVLLLIVVGMAEMSWNVWMDGHPPAGTFPPQTQVESIYSETLAQEASRHNQLSENQKQNLRAYLEQQYEGAKVQYVQSRGAISSVEWAVTLLSLFAFVYAWFAVCGANARSHPADTRQSIGSKLSKRK